MISTDFAPNEDWDDAWLSLKLLFQPWRWNKGNQQEKVEKQILKLFNLSPNQSQVSSFLSGRSALCYLLKSLNLPRNTEVVIQAFTCEAVVLPVLANELKPVYIDIETETFSMNFNELTNKMTNNSRVLILQHTFGVIPKHRKKILEFAKKNKLIVIEDLAHGFDPNIFKTKYYELSNMNFLLLSFGRSKALSSVFGGVIVSSNSSVMNQLKNYIRKLSYPSTLFIFKTLIYKPLTMIIKSTYEWYLGKIIHRVVNLFHLLIPEITSKEKHGNYDNLFNKQYPNSFATLLLLQLKKIKQIQRDRAKICSIYNRFFKHSTNYELQTMNFPMIRYPLLVENRKQILSEMAKRNIFLGKWYDSPVAPKDLDLERVGYRAGSCPVAEDACQKIVNLPTNISEVQAKKVVSQLNSSLPRD